MTIRKTKNYNVIIRGGKDSYLKNQNKEFFMKKQLMALSLVALLSSSNVSAWYGTGINRTNSKVVVTLMTSSGGYTTTEVQPDQRFRVGDYNRCFGHVKVDGLEGPLKGQSVVIGRTGLFQNECNDWNDIKITETMIPGNMTPFLTVNGVSNLAS